MSGVERHRVSAQILQAGLWNHCMVPYRSVAILSCSDNAPHFFGTRMRHTSFRVPECLRPEEDSCDKGKPDEIMKIGMKHHMSGIVAFLGLFFCLGAMAQPDIIKSPGDNKSYRYLKLPNEMKVLLVSDPGTDKSAVSLDVHVGNSSDPDDWAGLAHFLEHMLFLGTRKYPDADEYQTFIKTHGGSQNAYTSFDHTNYHFSIAPAYLEPALDRFSRFFIDPVLDPQFVDRERMVVHSEFEARKEDEGRRMWDARKRWLNPQHPASRFTVGTLKTLADREDESARDRLIRFYRQHYSANIMTLAVIGREELDQLEEWVVEMFGKVENRQAEIPMFTMPYVQRGLVPARLDSVSEKQQYSVSFNFPIPSTLDEYDAKPLGYIAHLLGHEGPGSLHHVLKEEGWAESLGAGIGYMDRVQGMFSIRIGLTSTGTDHVEEIGALLFRMIDLVRNEGIELWRFEEQSRLGEIAFRFAPEEEPGRLARSLASRLHRYPADKVLNAPFLLDRFDPRRIRELLDYLTPDNVNLHVVAPDLTTDRVTEYYDVGYRLEKIPPEMVSAWKMPRSDRRLTLSGPNRFIPERLELLGNTGENQNIPTLLDTGNGIELWYQKDDEFGSPRASFYVNIMSPVANGSPEDAVLTELYVRFVNHRLNRNIYDAYLADLDFSLYRHARGISVRISGFEDRQSELLQLMTDALESPQFEPDRLALIRDRMERELKNVRHEPPSSQTMHELYRLMMKPYWTEQEQLDVLREVTVEKLESFMDRFFRNVRVVALSHGDISRKTSLQRSGMLFSLFRNSSFIETVGKPVARPLRQGESQLRTLETDSTDSGLTVYFQGQDNSREERARMALLAQLVEPRFYYHLRTLNQVGYLVYSGVATIGKTPGLYFTAQSPSHTPAQVNGLLNEFIGEFRKYLQDLPEQQLADARSGLINDVLRKPRSLVERSRRYWWDINDEEHQFDSRRKFASILEGVERADIQRYFDRNVVLVPRRLTIQSAGQVLGGAIRDAGYRQVGRVEQMNDRI